MSRIHSRKGLYAFIAEQTAMIPPDARVLSVGSGGGIGRLIARMSNKTGFSVCELDVDSGRNPDIVGDIHEYRDDEKFDVVILCEVLEHLYDPWKAIANIHGLLRTEGRVIITAPFIFPLHDEPADYYRFTEFGLRKILEGRFRIELLERSNKPLEAIAVLLYRLHTERGLPARILGMVAVLLSPLIYVIIRFFLFFVGGDRITTRYHLVAQRIG